MNNVAESFISKAKWAAAGVWKRRWLALASAVAAAVVAAGAVAALPNRYEASARIFVDTQTVLKPLMAGLTYQPDIDQQVRMLARTLISRPNVERLVKVPELELDVSDAATREEVVSNLMNQIKVVSAGTGNLYEISYRGTSPERARRLVESTVALFVNSGAVAKKRDSEDAGRFIQDQIRTYETKLVEAENRLKDFKLRNFGISGVSNQDHFARMSQLSDEVKRIRLELTAAEQSRDAFRRELAAEDPQLPPGALGKVSSPAVADVEARLEVQRKQLDDLLRRFTDEHPDVVSARRIIGLLEAELVRARQDAARPAGGEKPGRAATSPVYQRIRVSLAEAEARVASLRAQLGSQQVQLNEARAVAGRVPQVEAEFAQLNRDYDVLRKNYEQMVARRESATLGVKLDESSQMAEFRLIEPPRVSPSPVFPSRLHGALIGVLASVLGGVIAALAAEKMQPTLDTIAALQAVSGRPVIGSVSMLETPELLEGGRAAARRFMLSAGVLLTLQAAWLLWIAMQSHN